MTVAEDTEAQPAVHTTIQREVRSLSSNNRSTRRRQRDNYVALQ